AAPCGHGAALGSEGHAAGNANLFDRAVVVVVLGIGLNTVVGHKEIGPAVVVIISRADRKILTLWLINFGRYCNVGECAVSIVVIQRVWAATIFAGRTAAEHCS